MRIGELAAATGVSSKTLRFYEAEGLLPAPERTAAGYRDYSREVVGRVSFIRRAQAAGLTLTQIGEVLALRDDGHPPCAHVADAVDERVAEVNRRLEELDHLRGELLALRERLDGLDPVDCDAGAICAAVPVVSAHEHAGSVGGAFGDDAGR